MEVTLTINAPALAEAINNLAGAIAATAQTSKPVNVVQEAKATQHEAAAQQPVQSVAATQPQPTVPVQPPQTAATPQPQPVAQQPVQTAPVQPQQPVAAPQPQPTAPVQPAPVTPAKPITLEALCEAGAKLVEAGKMDQVIAMLTRYGVQAINQLPTANYEAFAAELRGIGGQI